MASSPPTDDPRDMAFIREVDEAYREEELKRYFLRYGRWVALAIGVGLLALGGWFWWQAETHRKADAMSEQFASALDQLDSGASEEARAELAEIRHSSNPSYQSLAALAEAGIALGDADTDKAIDLFRSVADNDRAPQALREAARLRLVNSQMDTLQPDEIVQQLQPFLDGDSLWFPVAGEMAAMAHLRAGANDKAADLFFRIAGDDRAPQSLRARSEQMAAWLGRDVTELADKREASDAGDIALPDADNSAVEQKENGQ